MISIFVLALLLAALPQIAPQPFELTADESSADLKTGEMISKGHARLTDGQLLLTADEIRANRKTGVASASGHVVMTLPPVAKFAAAAGPLRLLADKVTYRQLGQAFTAEKIRLGAYPYYAEGDSATGADGEIVITHATVTYGEPGPWQPTLKADKIFFAPGQHLRAEGSQAGIGSVQPFPFPKFTQNLHESFAGQVSFTGGYRSSLGAFVDASLLLPVAPGVFVGPDVGLYSARGVMVGPAGSYSRKEAGSDFDGHFRAGYINDHGDKKTDLLGRPVPEERGYIEWQHTQLLTEHLSLAAQLNYWSDSEIVRDFRPRSFFPVQEPDSFIESNYAGKNYFISAFARFQPNSFQRVQERLPEIRFDLLPTPIGGGFIEQFNASYARLRERGPLEVRSIIYPPGTVLLAGVSPTVVTSYGPTTTLLQADRFDAYYALNRPVNVTDWFSITPVAGGRFTHYAKTKSFPFPFTPLSAIPVPTVPVIVVASGTASTSTSQTRTLGEIGFDATLRTSGTFAYKNETWKIDGLRHLFTPRLSYRYVRADKRNLMPAIDRPVFSTYLQPLGLGDSRAIDTMDSSNTLRLAFDNVLQTRDPTNGTRDLASLTIANDFGFTPGRRDLSGIQLEGALMPARWLQFDAYQRYAPRYGTLNEFNTGVTLHDAAAWSVRFSNNFLRGQIEDYVVDGRVRLNERYEALTRLHYDARKSRFNEQAYGVVQNLDNTWRISYVVSLYSGPRRESHFGLNVQIEATGF